MRKPIANETWLLVDGWQYEVSSLGHIRRKRSRKLINPWWDTDGYGTVILKKGKQIKEVYLDSLICSVFTGKDMNDERPLHLDGSPWNNWPRNLRWGMHDDLGNRSNLVVNWTVRHKGKLQSGPFTDHGAARAAAQWIGDVVIGRNPDRKVVAYETKYAPDKIGNPFDRARYFQAQAEMHNHQFWSMLLAEAACLIEALANENLNYITDGNPAMLAVTSNGTVEPVRRQRLNLSVAEQAEPPLGRRRVALPAE